MVGYVHVQVAAAATRNPCSRGFGALTTAGVESCGDHRSRAGSHADRSGINTADWTKRLRSWNPCEAGKRNTNGADSAQEIVCLTDVRQWECSWAAAVRAWNHVSDGQQCLRDESYGTCGT